MASGIRRTTTKRCGAVAVLATIAIGLTACGQSRLDEGVDPDADRDTSNQAHELGAFQEDAAGPEGYEVRECELQVDGRRLTVAARMPSQYELLEFDGGGEPDNSCDFVSRRQADPGIKLLLLHDSAAANEADDIGTLEEHRENFEHPTDEGDTAENVDWRQDVEVYGETIGDRLSWSNTVDGIPEVEFRAEADGVQVWVSASGDEIDAHHVETVFDQVTASVGTR